MKWQWLCSTILVILEASLVMNTKENRLVIMPSGPEVHKPINTKTLLTCKPDVDQIDLIGNLRWLDPNGNTIENDVRKYTETWPDVQLGLIIKSLQEEDIGDYTCEAKYDNKVLLQAKIHLATYVDITWEDAPAKQNPIAGQPGVIKCKVSAEPKPAIYWYKEGVLYKPAEGGRCSFVDDGIKCEPISLEDSGSYSCRARVFQTGSIGDRNIEVEVYTKPSIHPFEEVYEAKEDETLVVACKAEGNPPPTYVWYDKDNLEINDRDRYEVDEILGTLKIYNLVREDAGPIFCRASNTAGNETKQTRVRVIVKPKITKFESKSVGVGEVVTLQCHVQAEPDATVNFINIASGQKYSAEFQPFEDSRIEIRADPNPDSELTENIYTLEIDQVNRNDDGLYKCTADNQGGKVEATAHIQVEYVPIFIDTVQNPEYSWLKNPINISCLSSAIPNATVYWIFNDQPVEDTGFIKIFGNITQSTLQVTPNDASHFGGYVCHATNKLGTSTHTILLKQAFPPGKLLQTDFIHFTATTITFKLVGPKEDGGLPITEYIVEYSLDKHSEDGLIVEERKWPASTNSFILDKLKPEHPYKFRFAASNAAGTGEWTEERDWTMPQKAAPEEPKILAQNGDVAISPFPDRYTVVWKIPQDNGEKIVSFEVTYYPVRNSTSKDFQKDGDMIIKRIPHSGTTSYLLYDLKPNTFYRIEVRANNSIGNSMPGTLIIKTAKDPAFGSIATQVIDDPSSDSAVASMPIELIIGIAVAALIITIVVIDVICFVTNKCGILMFICVHVCSKQPPNDKVKEAAMEEGKTKDSKDIKKPEGNMPHVNEDDDAKDATEETPMIDGSKSEKEQEANKNVIESDVKPGKDSTV